MKTFQNFMHCSPAEITVYYCLTICFKDLIIKWKYGKYYLSKIFLKGFSVKGMQRYDKNKWNIFSKHCFGTTISETTISVKLKPRISLFRQEWYKYKEFNLPSAHINDKKQK